MVILLLIFYRQMRVETYKCWCTRALRSKTVCERVYVITCLLTATYTKQNIANGLVKKLLAIQSNLKQFCLLVIPLGFEPKTHSLEGCCSNPTELRDLQIECKGTNKKLTLQIFMSFLLQKTTLITLRLAILEVIYDILQQVCVLILLIRKR